MMRAARWNKALRLPIGLTPTCALAGSIAFLAVISWG